ncbi:hypothetical protein BGZ73_005858 [Actinomortierella ambigua]|nr:hypothetical protein BGZ73_005858 [Actinomortierella ambigua]
MVVHPRLIGVLLRGRSSWKALAETDYFVLQHHPRQARLPPFRIITRGFPHYRVAEGDQLELLQDELEYLTVMARQAIVGKVTSKKISAWLKASFQRQSVLAHATPDIHLLDQEHPHQEFGQYEDDDEDEEEEEEEDEDLDELDELDVDDEIEVEDDEVEDFEGDQRQFAGDRGLLANNPPSSSSSSSSSSSKSQKNKSIVDTHRYPVMDHAATSTASPIEIRPLKRSSSLEHVGASSSSLSPHRIPPHHHLSHTPLRPASSASVLLQPSSASASNVLQSHARTSSPEPMLDPIPRPHSAFAFGRYTLPGELDTDQPQSQYPRSHSLPTPDASPGEMSDYSMEDMVLLGNEDLDQARSIRSLQHAGNYGPYHHHDHRHPHSTAAPSIIGAGGEPLPSATWAWWTGSPFVDALVNWVEGPEHVARAKPNEKDKPNPLLDIPLQFIALLTYPEPDAKSGGKMTLTMVRETAFVKQRRRTLLILTVYTLLVRYCSFDFFLVLLFASNCGMLFLMKNSGRMNVNMAKRAVRQRVGWARQWAGSIFRRGNNNNAAANGGNGQTPQQQSQASSMTYQTTTTTTTTVSAPAGPSGTSSHGTGTGTSLRGLDSPTLLQDNDATSSSPPAKRKGLFARRMGLGSSNNSSSSNNNSINNSSSNINPNQTILSDGASAMTGTPSTATSKRRFFKRGNQSRSNTAVVAPTPTSTALHQSLCGTRSTLSSSSKAYLSIAAPSASAPPLRSQTLNIAPSTSASTSYVVPSRPFSPKVTAQATMSTAANNPTLNIASPALGPPPPVSAPASTTASLVGLAVTARKNSVPTIPTGVHAASGLTVPIRQSSPLPSPIPIPIPITPAAMDTAAGIAPSAEAKDAMVMMDSSSAATSLAWMGYSSSMPAIMPSGMVAMPPRPSISSSIVDGSVHCSSSGSSTKSGSAPRSPSLTPAPTTPSSIMRKGSAAGLEEVLVRTTASPPLSSSSASREQGLGNSPAATAYNVRFGPALAADELMDPVSVLAENMEGF